VITLVSNIGKHTRPRAVHRTSEIDTNRPVQWHLHCLSRRRSSRRHSVPRMSLNQVTLMIDAALCSLAVAKNGAGLVHRRLLSHACKWFQPFASQSALSVALMVPKVSIAHLFAR